jgi:hypothetical protein
MSVLEECSVQGSKCAIQAHKLLIGARGIGEVLSLAKTLPFPSPKFCPPAISIGYGVALPKKK